MGLSGIRRLLEAGGDGPRCLWRLVRTKNSLDLLFIIAVFRRFLLANIVRYFTADEDMRSLRIVVDLGGNNGHPTLRAHEDVDGGEEGQFILEKAN